MKKKRQRRKEKGERAKDKRRKPESSIRIIVDPNFEESEGLRDLDSGTSKTVMSSPMTGMRVQQRTVDVLEAQLRSQ